MMAEQVVAEAKRKPITRRYLAVHQWVVFADLVPLVSTALGLAVVACRVTLALLLSLCCVAPPVLTTLPARAPHNMTSLQVVSANLM